LLLDPVSDDPVSDDPVCDAGFPRRTAFRSARQRHETGNADPAPVVKEPLAFGLEDATPIRMRINRTVSSADAQVNDTVDFEVLD
jgi:hypothetical protein